MQEQPGLVEALQSLFGGAATSFIGAAVGRLMYHAREVRAKRRKVFSMDLVWEVPTIFGMALIGEGIANFLGLTGATVTGAITVVSYMGVKWVETVIEAWVTTRRGGAK